MGDGYKNRGSNAAGLGFKNRGAKLLDGAAYVNRGATDGTHETFKNRGQAWGTGVFYNRSVSDFASLSILGSAAFYAPLKSTLVLTRGSGDPTYSRATAAWEMDNEGKLITVPSGGSRFGGGRMVRNHATYTQDLSNAIWGKTRSNISANATTAPDGTLTADKLYDDSTAANSHISGQTIGNPVATGTYRATIRAKAAEYTYCQFRVTIDPASGNHQYGAVFNLSNGTIYDSGVILGTPTETACSIESIGDGWYLLSLNVGNPNNKRLDIQVNLLNGPTANIGNPAYNGDGTSGIYLWGLQVENVAGQADQTASEYVSVGVLSAPYHGAGVDGVKWFETNKAGTALSESSLLGYHAEGARTNNLLYSRDLTNAAWVATNITAVKTATGIDNAPNSASTLTAGAADATILQTLTIAAVARSSSAYVKRRTGSGNIYMTRDGGTNWTDITASVGSSWTRVKIENTSVLNPSIGFKLATSGDAIDVDCVQDEVGTFISSPIITTTAAVTRNAEVLTYTFLGNADTSIGSILSTAGYVSWGTSTGNAIAAFGTTAAANNGTLFVPSTQPSTKTYTGDGTNITQRSSLSSFETGMRKRAASWTGATMLCTGDGLASASGTFDGTMPSTAIGIGSYTGGGNQFDGYIKNAYIWQTALTDAQLKQVTA